LPLTHEYKVKHLMEVLRENPVLKGHTHGSKLVIKETEMEPNTFKFVKTVKEVHQSQGENEEFHLAQVMQDQTGTGTAAFALEKVCGNVNDIAKILSSPWYQSLVLRQPPLVLAGFTEP